MKKISILFVSMTLIFLVNSCSNESIEQGFINFDKAYIPSLILTNGKDVAKATIAINLLDVQYRQFSKNHSNAFNGETLWQNELSVVQSTITDSLNLINSEQDLKAAHNKLEVIRYTFIETRKRHNIVFFQDILTEYHDVMEETVRTAKELQNEENPQINESLATLTEKTKNAWLVVMNTDIDPEVYGLNDEEINTLTANMDIQLENIDTLSASIANNEPSGDIIKKATLLKKGYKTVFSAFGDFSQLQ